MPSKGAITRSKLTNSFNLFTLACAASTKALRAAALFTFSSTSCLETESVFIKLAQRFAVISANLLLAIAVFRSA